MGVNSRHSTLDSRPSVELHIEELVLHGFAPGDRHRIAAAVELELTRLFSEQPMPAALEKGISLDRIDGGAFQMAGKTKPASVGAQIAGAIHGGLIK